ncbi:MAG: ROK family transcriptional regulator [Cryobacterium sp.]|nr:ROK family transcriptional regulator [Cryobacterium sp.]
MNIIGHAPGRNHTDDVHRHNLSLLLTAVHRSGGVPRSRLTELSGLNRSTVSQLVAELVNAKLVVEAESASQDRPGRPSRFVRPARGVCAIAVNPEVDAISLALVGLGGEIIERERHALRTDTSIETVVSNIARMIDSFDLRGRRVAGIGAAIPGLVREADGVVRLAPHLAWVDEPFSELLRAATRLPVFSANDANVGANAESLRGAGADARLMVYLNGGASGIGGGIIVGGVPLAGSSGYAGEIGHTLVNSGGRQCHCGAIGCLETEVRRDPLLQLTGLRDDQSDELSAALAASTARPLRAEVRRQLSFLGIAVRNVINAFNPDRIVLGGFLAALHSSAPDEFERISLASPLAASRESVTIVPATLGRDVLMLGAAELAFAPLLADPIA